MTNQPSIPPDKWLIIVNPNAGVRKGAKDWPQISRHLDAAGINHLCVLTEHRNHANTLVGEFIDEGYRKIAVVGGDGTMNEVVNGIFLQTHVPPSEITLGMIPVGTGNDWCRTFGIPFGYKEAIGILKEEKTVFQDVGEIGYYRNNEPFKRFFINIAGMGYDALVAKKTNLSKEKGRGGPLTYLFFVFSGLFQYKFVDAVIEVDGEQVFSGEIFSMNVGICMYNGGGMKQVPGAVPDDGLFDVTLIKKAPKWMVIRYANKLYDGTLVDLPFVSTFRGKSIRIRSAGKIYLEADGESLGHSPLNFEILPRSLKVVTGNVK
ncbi:MAG: diacylglycerol kinase family lipid kinase [Bacteroidetes bacterium]|nr:diacylglycerol kinase family lipid kinase [Bacteroidota bacterium]